MISLFNCTIRKINFLYGPRHQFPGVSMNYSTFMNGLKKAEINMNRKMLSELAIHNPAAFSKLVETAKSKLAA